MARTWQAYAPGHNAVMLREPFCDSVDYIAGRELPAPHPAGKPLCLEAVAYWFHRIASVEFFAGTNSLARFDVPEGAPPRTRWDAVWENPPRGVHAVHARFTNVDGRLCTTKPCPLVTVASSVPVDEAPEPPAAAAKPDTEAQRRRTLRRARMKVNPVFARTKLPSIDFEQPGWVKNTAGPYRMEIAYYDADYHEVTAATNAGRYGAVVTVVPEHGDPLRRYVTLFRHEQALKWRDWRPADFRCDLPEAFGLDNVVVAKQNATLGDFVKWRFEEASRRDSGMAALLAGLRETKTEDPAHVDRTGVWSRDRLWWYGLRKKLGLVETRRVVQVPEDYDADDTKQWPLLLFLHGAGERGRDLARAQVHGPPKLVRQGKALPFIIVTPQCPPDEWWLPEQLGDLLDEIMARYRVDPDRVYCTEA